MEVGLKNGSFDLADLLRGLYRRGITSILVEGGGHTIGSFLDAGLVDRLELFVAPKVFGAGQSWVENSFSGSVESAAGFQFERIRRIGEDLWITAMKR